MVENVLLITVDSLRKDSLPLEKGGWDETPAAAELYESGISFERTFATGPATAVSFPGILTGTLPLSYGGLGPLSDSRPRLASAMKEEGFVTGGFQCNPFLSHHFNYDEGFDTFEDYQNPLMGIATKIFPRGIEVNNPKLRKIDEKINLTKRIKDVYQFFRGKPRPYVSAEVITDDCLEWLETTDQPFFGWAHYMDVHHPCFPPADYREEYDVTDVSQQDVSEWYSLLIRSPEELTSEQVDKLEKLYCAAISYTDDQINRLIKQLKEDGRYEDTLILYTSDHGELFGDHDMYGKPERMFDELLHVPLLIANGPEKLADCQDDLLSLLDIPRIILDTVGADIPPEYEGIVPGEQERDHILAEHHAEGDTVLGVRTDDWLFEVDEMRDAKRLFELTDNGIAERSVADEGGHVQSIADQRLTDLDIDSDLFGEELEDGVEDRLEDLGYIS